jgi:hypothetical protein
MCNLQKAKASGTSSSAMIDKIIEVLEVLLKIIIWKELVMKMR